MSILPSGGLADLLKPWEDEEDEPETTMPAERKIYEVYEVANGYFARLASGQVVVARTLADVASEAHALITQEMTEEEVPPPAPKRHFSK